MCAEGDAVEYNFVQVLNLVKGIPDVKVTVAVTRTKGIGVEKVVTIVVTHVVKGHIFRIEWSM